MAANSSAIGSVPSSPVIIENPKLVRDSYNYNVETLSFLSMIIPSLLLEGNVSLSRSFFTFLISG
jgi:hypothetical protein